MKRLCAVTIGLMLTITAICVAAGLIYKDSLTGAQIDIPEGWHEELSDLDSARTIFASDDGAAFVLYNSHDMLTYLPDEADPELIRKISDMRIMTPEAFALALGVDFGIVDNVTIGGFGFYRAEYERSFPDVNGDYTLRYASYLHVRNGYQFIFTYGIPAELDNARYRSDLDRMLESLKLPSAGGTASDFTLEFVLIAVLFVLLIICAVLTFLQSQKRKRIALEQQKLDEEAPPDDDL